jgi:hypothetical protein
VLRSWVTEPLAALGPELTSKSLQFMHEPTSGTRVIGALMKAGDP